MQLDRILVATDLTEAGRSAHRHAAAFARAFGASVTALHVDEVAPSDYPEVVAPDFLARLEALRRERLDELRADFAALQVPLEIVVAPGRARRVILEQAATLGAQLIVAARHARRRVQALRVGTTALRVLRLSEVPVLIVPVAEPGAAPSAELAPVEHVLGCTDFSQDGERGLRAAADLARHLGSTLTALHVVSSVPDVQLFSPAGDDAHEPRLPVRLREEALAALEHTLEEVAPGRSSPHVASGPRTARAIAATARELDVDLIALAATGRGELAGLLLGGTARRVVKRAGVPVLVFPKRWLERYA